jgi:hypothetical protein
VNISNAVRKAPSVIGKSNALNNTVNGAWVAGSAFSMFGLTTDFMSQMNALRRMHSDITGEDYNRVSTYKLLLGKVPAPVAEARSQLLTNSGIQGVIQTAFLAFNVKQFMGGKMSWLSNSIQAGMMFGAPVLGMVVPQSVLPVYDAVRKAHASGQKLPPEFIAEFIGAASSELRKRGGAESGFTRELAKQYAAENTSPADMLKEINSGALMERVKKIIASNKTSVAAAAAAPQVSHVDKLNGKAEALAPVVGKHTQDEAARRGAAENTLGQAL